MKNKKPFLNMDERNKQIAFKVMTVLYLLNILAMQGIVLYRQFALAQDLPEFEDLAILMTVNSLILISALLFFGAIPIQKLSVKRILLIYLFLVVVGSLFTYVKYTIFQGADLTVEQLFDKLIIIVSILAIMMGTWVILSMIAKRRMEKELE